MAELRILISLSQSESARLDEVQPTCFKTFLRSYPPDPSGKVAPEDDSIAPPEKAEESASAVSAPKGRHEI